MIHIKMKYNNFVCIILKVIVILFFFFFNISYMFFIEDNFIRIKKDYYRLYNFSF